MKHLEEMTQIMGACQETLKKVQEAIPECILSGPNTSEDVVGDESYFNLWVILQL